ncbi:MAG: AAA family ATPase [Desulfobacterales bacterium]|nr:AAA family ATPase [Pseudomonadota bacterium]MBU4355063.1 AAA family ATPase [Pseudomonadota bacterium]MCG2773801.1 AAA family ATPase [Desulfobacterales bacterium]
MLTRLKVSGFKNLVDVDVYFGPFTCVAGANAVGKSNLFDAIHFLSALADRPLLDAALSVRNESGRSTDVTSLFHRVGDDFDREMSFVAEMIVPQEGWDDMGQRVEATNTFLQYSLTIAYREEDDDDLSSLGPLELKKEELVRIFKKDSSKKLPFLPMKEWRDSVVRGKGRRTPPFISTEGDGNNRVINLHQDGTGGQTLKRSAVRLPRTVLSALTAAESPTALLARREMQSWRLLQLEPSSLREPDGFRDPTKLGTDGSHLAATLYYLARRGGRKTGSAFVAPGNESRIYGQIALRLSGLIDDVYEVWVDRDKERELLTLYVNDRMKTPHPARALSDGTLRFLALAVLELDPETEGLLCLEEPENGIHPQRIPAMLRLLEDIAVDSDLPIGTDNFFRQVIVNTHSPAVVAQVDQNNLLVAELKEDNRSGKRFKKACFSCLSGTWRAQIAGASIVSKGKLLSFLNPIGPEEPEDKSDISDADRKAYRSATLKKRRVADREDLRQLRIPFSGNVAE